MPQHWMRRRVVSTKQAVQSYRGAVNLQQAGKGLAVPDQVLLDVGAGAGYFSLAAAARGHRAIAVELSNVSLASLEASVAYNGFGKLITVHKARAQPRACALCTMSMLWLALSGCSFQVWRAGGTGVCHTPSGPRTARLTLCCAQCMQGPCLV